MGDAATVEARTKKVEQQLDALEKDIETQVKSRVDAEVKSYIEKNKKDLLSGMGLNHVPGSTRYNSDEQKCLRMFGAKSWRELIDINVCDRKFARVPMEFKHMAIQLKMDVDISRHIQQILHGEAQDKDVYDPKNPLAGVAAVKGMVDGNFYGRDVLAPKLKAFDTTVDAALVPTALSSQYIEEFELERQVMELFQSINMPTKTFQLPKQSSTTTARLQGENGTLTGTKFGSGQLEFNAIKLAEFYELSEELNEDSAPAILAFARDQVTQAQGRAWETATINGKRSAPLDADVTDADDARRAWDGHRQLAIANSANGSTVDFGGLAATLANCRAMRIRMGKFGTNPRNLVWIASPKVYYQMIDFDEVTTVDKFGNDATVKTGVLAMLDGVPIIQSEYVRDDVDATGVHSGTPANDILSTLHLVNHRRFFLGIRRPLRVRATFHPVPPNDQWLLASWWRGDYTGHEQDANEVSTTLGINIG